MENGAADLMRREIRTLYALGRLGDLTDAQLLELFVNRRGDDAGDAFAALVERHGSLVLGVCRRILADPHDAEDAFQATFLVLVRRAASIGRRERLASWLYGVALRSAKEAKRRAARQHAREGRLMKASRVEPAPDDRSDWLPLLDEELCRLPERYRAALVACEIEGKSRREAALELGLPEGTLSTHLARGRKLLRERLERRGVSPGTAPLAGLTMLHAGTAVPERLAVATIRGALEVAARGLSAASVPATVSVLVDRVLKSMLIARLAAIFTATAAIGLAAAVAGAAVLGVRSEPDVPARAQELAAPATKENRDQDKLVRDAGQIQGIVVDESGEPIPRIEVVASGDHGQPTRGVTDARGQFALPYADPDLHPLLLRAATADGIREGIYFSVPRLKFDKAWPNIRIVCKPARDVRVLVVDRGGRPLPDAELGLTQTGRIVAQGRSNRQGLWSVRVPELNQWSVVARKAGLGFDYAVSGGPWDRAHEKPIPEQLTLVLDGARPVRVRTVDGDGKPVAGVSVGISSMVKEGHERFQSWVSTSAALWPATDRDGIAVLDWLPEPWGTGIALGVHARDYYSVENTGIRPNVPEDFKTITLLPLEPLSGRVTYPGGGAAPGVVVSISGQGRRGNLTELPLWWTARTDDQGQYHVKLPSSQAYVLAVMGKQWTAPYRTNIVVHPGKPRTGVDFVLQRPIRVHGRLTVGQQRPTPGSMVLFAVAHKKLSEEVGALGNFHLRSAMHDWVPIDQNDEYEIYLGPGDYRFTATGQRAHVELTIPAVDAPAEIRQDIDQPPELGTRVFAIHVVNAANRPVAGAIVDGWYPSQKAERHQFDEQTTNERGTVQTYRRQSPLLLHARSSDGSLANVIRIDAEAFDCRVVVRPVAIATGRFLDANGKPLSGKSFEYGLRVDTEDLPRPGLFTVQFGATGRSDEQGRFRLTGLVPGQSYTLWFLRSPDSRHWAAIATPESSATFSLGDVRVRNLPE